uniref:Uncharacterized protein n=1 Tax=Leersia perrieri TaxID=77586 RepID=A0A0D9VDG2_9ORYZ
MSVRQLYIPLSSLRQSARSSARRREIARIPSSCNRPPSARPTEIEAAGDPSSGDRLPPSGEAHGDRSSGGSRLRRDRRRSKRRGSRLRRPRPHPAHHSSLRPAARRRGECGCAARELGSGAVTC